ncbi:MAG: ribonuclease HII [Nanoarchaeota archaeon]|nr:ribonuclease HII [Nanoarchaeota archaeon]
MKILGIDEAGRGPVIGPLIMGGVLIHEEKRELLREIGVKDSKQLLQEKRVELAEQIIKNSLSHELIEVSAEEINESMNRGINLTELEIQKMAEIINKSKPDKTFIDMPMKNKEEFMKRIQVYLTHDSEIIAENKADQKYPVVSAASILAKVRREEKVKELHKKIGFFGSGYSSDERTITFLEKNYKKPEVNAFLRKNWKTLEKIEASKTQTQINSFL